MSKPYGLIVPNKDKTKSIFQRPSIFNDDSDDSNDSNRNQQQKQPIGLKRPLKKQDKITQKRALEQDPTVYQYDEIYDEMDKKRKESKLLRKDLDRKPKYINKLLETAERRKKENERRIERQIQKERDAEGEQYKDKESFVTSAYRKKLEEIKQMDELEKREEYLETIGDVTKQQNLDGFYRHLYQQKVNYSDDDNDNDNNDDNDNKDKKQENIKKNQQCKQRQYRKRDNSNNSDIEQDNNHDNDDNKNDEIDNKKEHLPSNLDADSDFSIDSSSSDSENDDKETNKISTDNNNVDKIKQEKIDDVDDKQNVTLEKTNVIIDDNDKKVDDVKNEEIPIEPATSPPPVKKTKIDIWKKRTIGDVFQAALQRYFERKALREL